MTDAPLLQVRNLTRRYKLPRQSLLRAPPVLTALEGAAFSLHAGETLGVVGESGSGKSTLARLIMAFERPDAGRCCFKGAICMSFGAKSCAGCGAVFRWCFKTLSARSTRAAALAGPSPSLCALTERRRILPIASPKPWRRSGCIQPTQANIRMNSGRAAPAHRHRPRHHHPPRAFGRG